MTRFALVDGGALALADLALEAPCGAFFAAAFLDLVLVHPTWAVHAIELGAPRGFVAPFRAVPAH